MDAFSHGSVTHEVRYRIVPFRSMDEDLHWVPVSLILNDAHFTRFDNLESIFAISFY